MILFLYGEESWLVRDKLKQIRDRAIGQGIDATNTAELDGSEAELPAVREAVMAAPFIAKQRLVTIRDWLLTRPAADSDALVTALEQVPDTTIVVVAEFGLPDRRRTAFKTLDKLSEKSWQFSRLDESAAARWASGYAVEQKGELAQPVARHLVSLVGRDLWTLSGEVDKLVTAADGPVSVELVDELVSDATPADIFALVDGIGRRDAATTLGQWRKLLGEGEPALRIFAMVVRQVRILLNVQALHSQGVSEPQLVKQLGLHPYVVKKALAQSKSFTETELHQLFHQLAELDEQIKTGTRDPEPTLEVLLTEICSGQAASSPSA